MKNTKKKISILTFAILMILMLSSCKSGDVVSVKTVKDKFLTNSSFGKVSYSGELVNGLPEGEGVVKIENDEFVATLMGNFKESNFIEGEILIEYKNEEKFINSIGKFEKNGLSGLGETSFNLDNITIIKNGEFKDNSLNGRGKKTFYKNGLLISQESGFFKNDKLER